MEAHPFQSKNTGGRALLRTLPVLFFILPALSAYAQHEDKADTLLDLLPAQTRLNGWILDGTPQTAAGQELYLLINGGAEIYLQAGFEKAVLASYRSPDGKVINVEIYQLAAVESARNVQRMKTSTRGKATPIGEEAVLEDYFLNMRQGPFQATFSGYDAQRETVATLLEMARMVAENINSRP